MESFGYHCTITDTPYWCPSWCRIINAMMRPVSLQYRVETGIRESRGYSIKVERRL
ncbi:hypothetical protein EVA_09533 [gut metagenome]|uniref:Uncharacterized protein n=1 Tax=gut metagenome TaxID=749906 RepID=J9G556_9ZZZZ